MAGTRPSQRAAHVGHQRHGARASRTHEHVGTRCARSRRLENAVCLAGDRNRLRLELTLAGWLGATGESWMRAVFPYQPARALRSHSPLAWQVSLFCRCASLGSGRKMRHLDKRSEFLDDSKCGEPRISTFRALEAFPATFGDFDIP